MLVVDFPAQRFEFPALLLAFHPANFGTAAGSKLTVTGGANMVLGIAIHKPLPKLTRVPWFCGRGAVERAGNRGRGTFQERVLVSGKIALSPWLLVSGAAQSAGNRAREIGSSRSGLLYINNYYLNNCTYKN